MRQRGYRESDLTVILQNGTTTHDGVVLSGKDVAMVVSNYRREIAKLERLKGSAVFLAEGKVVSVYRPSKSKVRRMIRHGRGRKYSRKEVPMGDGEW